MECGWEERDEWEEWYESHESHERLTIIIPV